MIRRGLAGHPPGGKDNRRDGSLLDHLTRSIMLCIFSDLAFFALQVQNYGSSASIMVVLVVS